MENKENPGDGKRHNHSMILSGIDMVNGVNEKGEAFVTITTKSTDNQVMIGQLSPQEIRQHAMSYLEVAEAAEQDAATLRVVRKLELPDQVAAMIITELRDSRK